MGKPEALQKTRERVGRETMRRLQAHKQELERELAIAKLAIKEQEFERLLQALEGIMIANGTHKQGDVK